MYDVYTYMAMAILKHKKTYLVYVYVCLIKISTT